MTAAANYTKTEIREFKELAARQQHGRIARYFREASRERMSHAMDWVENYASDLVDETAPAVLAFDVWFVVTQLYDVDIPNDVVECLVEEADAGRLAAAAQPWRNLLVRQQLPWRKFTKRDLNELGAGLL